MVSSKAPAPPGGPEHSDLGPLLEPSLDGSAAPTEPLFSTRASALVAFFGGVFAAALFSAVNAARMGKARADGWILALFALGWAAALFWASQHTLAGTAPEWLEIMGNAGRTVRLAGKITALTMVGILYLRRRPILMGQALAGVDSANPWPTAIASILVGMAVSFAIAMAAAMGTDG